MRSASRSTATSRGCCCERVDGRRPSPQARLGGRGCARCGVRAGARVRASRSAERAARSLFDADDGLIGGIFLLRASRTSDFLRDDRSVPSRRAGGVFGFTRSDDVRTRSPSVTFMNGEGAWHENEAKSFVVGGNRWMFVACVDAGDRQQYRRTLPDGVTAMVNESVARYVWSRPRPPLTAHAGRNMTERAGGAAVAPVQRQSLRRHHYLTVRSSTRSRPIVNRPFKQRSGRFSTCDPVVTAVRRRGWFA